MNYKKKAFTLIELLVGIAILTIITLGVTKLFQNNIPDKQKLELFTNKIIGIIDSIKNYSLVGKGIGTTLETPKYFKIELSTGTLLNGLYTGAYLNTYYNTGISDSLYKQSSIGNFDNFHNIQSIKCRKIDLSDILNATNGKVSIFFEGSNISLSGCSDNYHKIVDFRISYKGFNKLIRFNAINGVIEDVKY